MKGSLALVGSGEYLPAMAQLEKSLFDDGVKNGKKAIYIQIPTAAGRESPARLQYWADLGRAQADLLGVESISLPIFDREGAGRQEYVGLIHDSAMVYLSGGDPHYLATSLRGTPVWAAILANWQSGASLMGCSAGAMVLSSQIPNFRLSKNVPTKGLDVIPNLRVIPHFNKFFKWIPDSAAKILMHVPDSSILIGIDDLTAVVKRGGEEIWRVEGVGKLHILKGLPAQELTSGQSIILS